MHSGKMTRMELVEKLVCDKMMEISRLTKELAELNRKYETACEHIENLEAASTSKEEQTNDQG